MSHSTSKLTPVFTQKSKGSPLLEPYQVSISPLGDFITTGPVISVVQPRQPKRSRRARRGK